MNNNQGLNLLSLLCLTACSQTSENVVERPDNNQQSYQQSVEREQAIAKSNPWHAAKLKGVSFRAIGQEPAWLIEFYPDEKIYLSRDYGTNIQTFNYQVPVTDQAARRSVFPLEINHEKQGEVIVEGKPCSDIMSGELFEASVTIIIENITLKGCGRALY